MNLKGQVALITGAASGLGEATARALNDAGCQLVLLDKDGVRLDRLAEALGALSLSCDITDSKSIDKAICAAVSAYKKLTIAVNCAGISLAQRLVNKDGPVPLLDFQKLLHVNLLGSVMVMQQCAHQMMRQPPQTEDGERGVIINTASVAAFDGQVGQIAYSASKGAIVSMTLPAAREFAPRGVRVMAIAPGVMGTPMVSSFSSEVREGLSASVPFPPRLGLAEEYACLVLSIVQNSYLNGEVIRLDGALRMGRV